MNRTLNHLVWFDDLGQRRSTAGELPRRATIIFAALFIPNILAGTGRADTAYSGRLDATLTVAGFLDSEGNTISKPAGLTLEHTITFSDDSLVVIEGDATANADAIHEVIADDPSDLVAGDRFKFDFAVSGTTVYPTGFSYASALGSTLLFAENNSSDPVTILFDFDYDYTASTSVDDPELEQAYVFVDYTLFLDLDMDPISEFFAEIYSNESLADMGTVSFEVTLLPGEGSGITVGAGVTGDPFGPAVPEPTGLVLLALAVPAMMRRRHRQRTVCARISFYRTADQGIGAIR
jgi:hypothetical protein